MTWLALSFTLLCPDLRACPDGPGANAEPRPEGRAASEEAAAHPATRASLIGANCSYTTGSMARRVMAEGVDWSAEDRLEPAANSLETRVAVPYVLHQDPSTYVVASELLQVVPDPARSRHRLAMSGRTLEVDGVRYVVLTAFRVIHEG